MSRQKANLLCILTALIWGGGFIATDLALKTFTPFAMLLIRFVGAALLSWIPVLCQRETIKRQDLKTGVCSGVFLYAAFAFQTFGLELTEPGMNAFLTSVNVVFVPYLAWIVWKKRPDRIVLGASFICLAGLGCLSLSTGRFQLRLGDLLSLGCAFFFAAQIVSLGAARESSVSVLNAIQLSTAALCSLPFGLSTVWPARLSMPAFWSMAYSVVLSTFICYLMQTAAQQYTSPAAASILLATESLWANLFGFLLLHEQKTPVMVFGGFLIFISVVLVESGDWMERNWRRLCGLSLFSR